MCKVLSRSVYGSSRTPRSGCVGNSFHAAARRVAYQAGAVVHSDRTIDTQTSCGMPMEEAGLMEQTVSTCGLEGT